MSSGVPESAEDHPHNSISPMYDRRARAHNHRFFHMYDTRAPAQRRDNAFQMYDRRARALNRKNILQMYDTWSGPSHQSYFSHVCQMCAEP